MKNIMLGLVVGAGLTFGLTAGAVSYSKNFIRADIWAVVDESGAIFRVKDADNGATCYALKNGKVATSISCVK